MMGDPDNYYGDENEAGFEFGHEEYEYGDEIDYTQDALAVIGTYEGQRNSNNERHGFGKAILPNGDAYVGTYRDGERHGYGQYSFKSGAKYQGCYKEGLRNGKGVMYYPDKSVYEGYWINNKKDGDGVFKYDNNDVFSGSWKADMKHGLGTYTFCKTKAVLKGTWFQGKRVGNFELYFPTNEGCGFTFYGAWDSDDESVVGDGYFVFESSACMLKGVHVDCPFHINEGPNEVNKNLKTMWISNKILPIITDMLPRLPKKRPMVNKRSSCEMKFPPTSSHRTGDTTTSELETYEHKDDLWNETEELETGMDLSEIEYEQDATEMSMNQQEQENND